MPGDLTRSNCTRADAMLLCMVHPIVLLLDAACRWSTLQWHPNHAQLIQRSTHLGPAPVWSVWNQV